MRTGNFSTSARLLRSLPNSTRTTQCQCKSNLLYQRGLHSSRTLKEEGRSFRGQLYDSTFKRLERERAEQRRLAKERMEPQSLAIKLRWASGIAFLLESLFKINELTGF